MPPDSSFFSYNVLLCGMVGKLNKSEGGDGGASWDNEISVLKVWA